MCYVSLVLFCCKHKKVYELRISCWISDVCSSDLTNDLISMFDYTAEKHRGLAALSVKCSQECEFHALYFDGVLKGLQEEERKPEQKALCLRLDRKCVVKGMSVSVRVELVGGQSIRRKIEIKVEVSHIIKKY